MLYYDSLTTIVCDVMVLILAKLAFLFSSPVDPQSECSFTSNNGYTAAMLAAKEGHLDCLEYLVENKADVHAKVRGVLGEFGAGVVFDVWAEDAVENICFTK